MIDNAKNPCVFLSGGVDSLLVLDMAREEMPDIPIYCFNQNFTKEQWRIVENLIKELDLEVRSFPPMNTYIVPNGKTLAQVSEYNLNGVVIPILRDFIDGPKCSLTLDKTRLDNYPFEHDVVLVGSRKEDTSFATGQPFKSSEIVLGGIRFVAPLFEFTKEEVLAEARKRGLPVPAVDGDLPVCTKCLEGEGQVFCPLEQQAIDSFEWDKDLALTNFRTKFGFQVGEKHAN